MNRPLQTVVDVHCTYTICPHTVMCSECPGHLCPVHSDEFTTCVLDDDILHHLDCADECIECTGARAEDHDDDMAERYDREGW